MRRVECTCSVNLNRSPIHSLYPPVLPPTRDPILDECKSYWAQLCFATFPQTVRLAGLFPLEKLDIVAVRLFVVWPVLQAGREALVQWANVSAGWAILHAAIPNNAGYDVGVTAVMRTGAVGGAMVQVIALGLKLLEVATHARRGILPKDKPTAPELNRTILVRHLVWASVVALVETAVASLAAVLGVSVLKYSGTETMDIEHAVLSATVGAPILYVPQAIWYLYLIYRAWREIVRQEHPVRDSEKE